MGNVAIRKNFQKYTKRVLRLEAKIARILITEIP